MTKKIKVLFNNNEIVGLETMKQTPDDNYTVLVANLNNEETHLFVFDNDIDNNVVDVESEDFVNDVMNTFVLYSKSLTSKPLSNYLQ